MFVLLFIMLQYLYFVSKFDLRLFGKGSGLAYMVICGCFFMQVGVAAMDVHISFKACWIP